MKENMLYVVGLGPGAYEDMTIKADRILKSCDVIVGYTVYVDLIKEYYQGKEFLTTPMKQEVDRCKMAFEEAQKGKKTAMVCSGDSGVYGMSGLIYELSSQFPEVEIVVIPGVTAACSGAAVLGAPLCHDFAVISLSDLLTPMDLIKERIECAAKGDLIMSIYNPSSKKRGDYLKIACDIILQYQSPDLICGIAQNIGREGQVIEVLPLKQLRERAVDMFTTVYIGNSQTKCLHGKMVTPRGYKNV